MDETLKDYKEFRISGDKSILYHKTTLDKTFSTSIEPQTFYKEKELELKQLGLEPTGGLLLEIDPDGTPIYLDKTNHYSYNSLGYRSPEFGEAKILYAGCSTTYGTGMPEEAIWGSVVANNLNMPYVNISKQGASAQWIVKNVLAYFEEYGHPEVVCCLFPDLYRMVLASNSSLLSYSNNPKVKDKDRSDSSSRIYDAHLGQTVPPELAPEYSKKPHQMVDVIPADAAIYASMQSILMLDQYCRANGIKFAWSTWDSESLKFLLEIKSVYPKNYSNLVSLEVEYWMDNPDKSISGEVFLGTEAARTQRKMTSIENCHQDLLKKYGVNFYRGMDDLRGIEETHPGVHQHAHIAESFIKFLTEKY